MNASSLAVLEEAGLASSRHRPGVALPGAAAIHGAASSGLAVTHFTGMSEPPRKRQSLLDEVPYGLSKKRDKEEEEEGEAFEDVSRCTPTRTLGLCSNPNPNWRMFRCTLAKNRKDTSPPMRH